VSGSSRTIRRSITLRTLSGPSPPHGRSSAKTGASAHPEGAVPPKLGAPSGPAPPRPTAAVPPKLRPAPPPRAHFWRNCDGVGDGVGDAVVDGARRVIHRLSTGRGGSVARHRPAPDGIRYADQAVPSRTVGMAGVPGQRGRRSRTPHRPPVAEFGLGQS